MPKVKSPMAVSLSCRAALQSAANALALALVGRDAAPPDPGGARLDRLLDRRPVRGPRVPRRRSPARRARGHPAPTGRDRRLPQEPVRPARDGLGARPRAPFEVRRPRRHDPRNRRPQPPLSGDRGLHYASLLVLVAPATVLAASVAACGGAETPPPRPAPAPVAAPAAPPPAPVAAAPAAGRTRARRSRGRRASAERTPSLFKFPRPAARHCPACPPAGSSPSGPNDRATRSPVRPTCPPAAPTPLSAGR